MKYKRIRSSLKMGSDMDHTKYILITLHPNSSDMGRIRSIKPELFRHEGLQELQKNNPKIPVILVFIGLFTVSDREGRFRAKAKQLHLDILPFMNFDMEEALLILSDADYILLYHIGEERYGQIINWSKHQVIHSTEAESRLPAYNGELTVAVPLSNGVEKEKEKEKEKESILSREQDFRKAVNEYRGKYTDSMLTQFFNYWSEPNKLNTKMRFELQKVFELNRRLAYWASRDRGFQTSRSIKSTNHSRKNFDT